MFSSHLDTAACEPPQPVALRLSRCGLLKTDGETIMGADCKTGAAIMICMAEKGIPGHYVWHAGEERGGKGSHARSKTHEEWYKANIKFCIALDRRLYGSVITKQGCEQTASNEFATSIIAQMGFGVI